MIRRPGRVATPAALALLLLVIAGGVGVGLAVLAGTQRVYTDAETIRVPAVGAPVRDVLWQPAARLADWPETDADEYEARLSPDGQTMLLVRGRPGGNADILFARRTEGGWSEPAALDALNSDADDLGPTFAADGRAIFFYSDREGGFGGFDLWVAERDDAGRWGEPRNLGESVNSTYNEYGPAIAPDGEAILFSSNRPNGPDDDGFGRDRWSATIREDQTARDYDLFRAPLDGAVPGDARPINELNTRWNEGAPAISPFGDFIYFASDRPGGLGGFDLYRAREVDGALRRAERLDDTVNSTANDLDPSLSMGGYELHFSSDRAGEGETARYRLYVSRSREVFTETERVDAGIDWDALLGPLLWLLLLLLLLLLALLLARQAKEDARWRRLSLLAKCLLASLLAHALLLYLLAFWQVAASIGEALRSPGGRQVIIASSAGTDGLRSQVRGGITELTLTTRDQTGAETPEFTRLLDAATETARLDAPPTAATPVERVAEASADDAAMPEITRPTEIAAHAPETQRQSVDAPDEVRVAQATEADVAPDATDATSDAAPDAATSVQTAQAALDPTRAPDTTPERVAQANESDAPLVEPRAAASTIETSAPVSTVAVAEPDAPSAARADEREVALDAPGASPSPTDVAPPVAVRQSASPAAIDAPPTDEVAPAPVGTADATDAAPTSVAPADPMSAAPAPPALAGVSTASPSEQQTQRRVGEETLAINPETAQPDGATVAAPVVTTSASRAAAVPTDSSTPEAPTPVVTETAALADAQLSALASTDAPALAGIEADAPSAEIAAATPTDGARAAEADTAPPSLAPTLAAHAANPSIEAQPTSSAVALDAPQTTEVADASLASAAAAAEASSSTDAPAPTPDVGPIELPGAIALNAPAPTESASQEDSESPVGALAPAVAAATDAPAPAVPSDLTPSTPSMLTPDIATPAVALGTLASPPTAPSESAAPAEAIEPSSTVALDLPAMDALSFDLPEAGSGGANAESAAIGIAATTVTADDAAPAMRLDPAPVALASILPETTMIDDDSLAPMARTSDANPRNAPTMSPNAAATPARTPGSIEPNLLIPMEFAPPAEAYAQRDEEVRRDLVEQLGGSEETEAAVANALAWLARMQSESGAWDADAPGIDCDDCGGVTNIQSDVALTGLALLCFLGADHTHTQPGPYQDTVRRGLEWLVAQQRPDGDLRGRESMYSHGIASIALAESFGMTGDPSLRPRVSSAVDFIIDARNRETGGWRYAPRQLGDTSVLGWQVMALVSARRSGVDVPEAIFDVADDWLDLVDTRSRPGLYAYQPGERPTFAMTAEGMFVRQLLGDEPGQAHMVNSADFVLRELPDWTRDPNTYGWYYATLAMFQHQGDAWAQWNEAVSRELLAQQVDAGPMAGSWAPADRWSQIGGRIYQTAICTLSLEVYYRYLPRFMQADARPVGDRGAGQ
ncbi:MAG: hypothetical protein ACF8QF_01005 [Phycisphaerales bacterium]